MELSLVASASVHTDTIARALYRIGFEYEKSFSRFLDTSELSLLNRTGTGKVSARFLEVLDVARKVYDGTDGICNPCVQVSRHGYDRSFTEIVKDDTERSTHDGEYPIRFADVRVHKDTRCVSLPEGQMLDFGSFLKGHVAQILADEAMRRGCVGVIVNIGGDVYTRGYDCDSAPFLYTVYNPVTDEDVSVGDITNGALATSGTYKRRWRVRGGTRTHILASDDGALTDTSICSVSVQAQNGALADAYATTGCAMGSATAEAWLQKRNIPYLFITNSGVMHGTMKTPQHTTV